MVAKQLNARFAAIRTSMIPFIKNGLPFIISKSARQSSNTSAAALFDGSRYIWMAIVILGIVFLEVFCILFVVGMIVCSPLFFSCFVSLAFFFQILFAKSFTAVLFKLRMFFFYVRSRVIELRTSFANIESAGFVAMVFEKVREWFNLTAFFTRLEKKQIHIAPIMEAPFVPAELLSTQHRFENAGCMKIQNRRIGLVA